MRIVFDIGGTHIRVARAEGRAPRDVKRAATPPEAEKGYETLVMLIERVAGAEGIEAIVGGVAGVIREDGTIVASPNMPGWNGFTLGTRLFAQFHISVTVLNDVLLATLGEASRGAGRKHHVVAHLRIGTGVGGACVAGGKLDEHARGFEPGHQIVDYATGATLESLTGGAALARTHGVEPARLTHDVYRSATRALAAGVWNAIVHWSPDVVVLGGSLMNEETAYRLTEVHAEVEALCSVIPVLPEIRVGTLGDDAGLYGACAAFARTV